MRTIRELLRDYAICMHSSRTGLEYPFKSNFVISTQGETLRLSFDEVKLIEKEFCEMNQIYPDLGKVLKLNYIQRVNMKEISKIMGTTINTVHRKISVAESYLCGRLDKEIKDLVLSNYFS